jgi:YD repeat-containing protein
LPGQKKKLAMTVVTIRLGRTTSSKRTTLTTSTFDAADQLQTAKDSSGTTTFTFDASGNQQIENAPGGVTTHTWNYENQRTLIVKPSGERVTMAFNADFRRVRKES